MAVRAIENFFTEDHVKLDDLLKQFRANKRKDYPKAKEYFKHFKFSLQRHIKWEEEILFPIFEDKTTLRDIGPTVVMRAEHRQIEDALEELHKKVQRQDPQSDSEEASLLALLKEHNEKEEKILYPVLDELTTRDEREEIFTRIHNLPLEQYKTCCQVKLD